MEIDRVIGGRYLLQRLIQQGQFSTVYQGIDQSFQRLVAVKSVPTTYVSLYREAVRKTAQFSFPNIIMLYDLVLVAERLYLVEEYVEGDNFAALLQAQLQPYEVAEYGRQMCAALLYAGSASRRICHGDLTPAALLRDRRGLIRVSNFALPSDIPYFTAWSRIGGDGIVVSDQDLAWGVVSPGRQADDTRAIGLLLYQLLAGRPADATKVEPPIDGRLRFMRNIPPELCELVARTVIRGHPQHITTVEVLHTELNMLTEVLEPPDFAVANVPVYQPQQAEVGNPRQFSVPRPPSGMLANPLPAGQSGRGLASYQKEQSVKLVDPSMEPVAPAAPTVADASLLPATSRNNYPVPSEETAEPANHSPLPLLWWLVLGLAAFILFFVIGYFVALSFVHL